MDRARPQRAGSNLIHVERFTATNYHLPQLLFRECCLAGQAAVPFSKAASADLGNGILPSETGGQF
jgi:hypothetical protein